MRLPISKTGAALPYSVTVLPQPIVSVTRNGVPLVPMNNGDYRYSRATW